MSKVREKIIVVDDNVTNLILAKKALAEEYDVFTVPSGEKLYELLKKITTDLILLDIAMPVEDGYSILKKLKSSTETNEIPVIFLTGKIDPENEILGLELGAVDYVTKPFSRELLLKRIALHIQLQRQKRELQNHNITLESEVVRKTQSVYDLQNSILTAIADLVERRDNATGGHIERTQSYLKCLIELLIVNDKYSPELSKLDIPLLITSSQLHDVGKISIRDYILLKQGKLDVEEFEEMKKHTIYGEEIIKNIERTTTENDFLHYAEIFALTHHERWDGTGYPHGLAGEDIPLHGRLMAIVDVYDALTNDRPYKDAYPHDLSVEIIKEGHGTQFDPVLCDVFISCHEEFEKIFLLFMEAQRL